MAGNDKLMLVRPPINYSVYGPAWAGIANMSDRRRAIVRELNKIKFGITPELVNSERVGNKGATGKAVVSGITMARAFYDITDDRGEIKHGMPVVFDLVTCLGVTGINPKWQKDEYKVVGKALCDYNNDDPNGRLIRMEFMDAPAVTGEIIARSTFAPGVSYPNIQQWSQTDPGPSCTQQYVWPFELPADLAFDPSAPARGLGAGQPWQGSGQYVWGYNTTRQYVAAGSYCHLKPAGVAGTQYYFEHWMFPSTIAKLDADLKQGENCLATLDPSCRYGIIGTKIQVDDRMLEDNKMIKQGTDVLVTLYRYSNGSDFMWRFAVAQSIKCPEKQPDES